MMHSEQINEISGALAKAQAEMSSAKKDTANPFFKSKYADLAAVVDAVRGPLTKNGIAFTQWPEAHDGGVAVVTMLSHTSGQWIRGEVFVPVSKADAQGYGSAITYGKRYGLQSATGVPSEDDDGNAAAKAPPASITPNGDAWDAMSPEEMQHLEGIATHCKGLIAKSDVGAAVDYIESQKLDADHKVALWTRFDAKERRQMKEFQGYGAKRNGHHGEARS